MFDVIYILLIFWDLLFGLTCVLSWRTFQLPLKRPCILFYLDSMSCRYLLSLNRSIVFFRPMLPYWFSVRIIYLLTSMRMLKCPTIIVTFLFLSVSICYVYLSVLVWRCMSMLLFSYPFFYPYTMPFLIFCHRLRFKVYFAVVNIAPPTFLSFPFAIKIISHPLTFSLCVSLALKQVF